MGNGAEHLDREEKALHTLLPILTRLSYSPSPCTMLSVASRPLHMLVPVVGMHFLFPAPFFDEFFFYSSLRLELHLLQEAFPDHPSPQSGLSGVV